MRVGTARAKGGMAATNTAENMNPDRTNISLRFVSEANFTPQVLHSKDAFLVAFWASWSKPCHVIDPILLEVAQTCAGKIEVVKVNADDNPNLSLWFGVQHIPTLLYFVAGQLRGQLIGTVSKDAILSLLSQGSEAGSGHVPSEKGETL